MIYQD